MPVNKQSLIKEMEKYFGKDIKRINHAKKVTEYAEEILKKEMANRNVVLAASVFHDIGIHAAEKKYSSTAGCYQEKEGPPIARYLLERMNVPQDIIEEACGIIGCHHTPGKINTLNFKVVYDADWLVNLKEEIDHEDKNKLAKTIDKVFLTSTGRALAKKLYL